MWHFSEHLKLPIELIILEKKEKDTEFLIKKVEVKNSTHIFALNKKNEKPPYYTKFNNLKN